MKDIFRVICLAVFLVTVSSPARAGESAVPLRGSFIQLNRELAENDGAWWDGLFSRLSAAGLGEVIIQYLAEGLGEEGVDYTPALDHIFAAAERNGVGLVLGLEHDPDYWVEITAPEKVLRDYFLLRASRNLRLQQRLLELYGERPLWTGYYIPDEIDDLSWREPERRRLVADYLRILTARIREADPGREISASAFFRSRTEPSLAARNLFGITGDSLDLLLLQDGQGGGDPSPGVLPLYYRSLIEERPGSERPRLAAVVEIFEETTAPGGDFAARPAPPGAVERRLRAAAEYFPAIYLFSFAAYADPEKGERAAAVYDILLRYRPRAAPGSAGRPDQSGD